MEQIIEVNNESCSYCKNEDDCKYKKKAMIATRLAVLGLRDCSPAYFSMELKCDYYSRDFAKYSKYSGSRCIDGPIVDLIDSKPIEVITTYGEPQEITLDIAMKVLNKALTKDKLPGSYYHGWQSNIAMTIHDRTDVGLMKSNEIAKDFLELLIGNNILYAGK